MKDNKTVHSSGIGLGTLLTIIFVILKLCGVISWSWIWVLAPLWISIALFLILTLVAIIVVAYHKRKEIHK